MSLKGSHRIPCSGQIEAHARHSSGPVRVQDGAGLTETRSLRIQNSQLQIAPQFRSAVMCPHSTMLEPKMNAWMVCRAPNAPQ